jgi:hypothetical protein
VVSSTQITEITAAKGCAECLRLLLQYGCAWHSSSFAVAARNGDTGVLEVASDLGHRWGSDVYKEAAQSGRLNCLKFLCGREMCDEATRVEALAVAREPCVAYLNEIAPLAQALSVAVEALEKK